MLPVVKYDFGCWWFNVSEIQRLAVQWYLYCQWRDTNSKCIHWTVSEINNWLYRCTCEIRIRILVNQCWRFSIFAPSFGWNMQHALHVLAQDGVNFQIRWNGCSAADSLQLSYHADCHVHRHILIIYVHISCCLCGCVAKYFSTWPMWAKSSYTVMCALLSNASVWLKMASGFSWCKFNSLLFSSMLVRARV